MAGDIMSKEARRSCIKMFAVIVLFLAALLNLAYCLRPMSMERYENEKQFAAVNNEAFFIVYPNGELMAWGLGKYGALGRGLFGYQVSIPFCLRRTMLEDVQSITANYAAAMAVDCERQLWMMGEQSTLVSAFPNTSSPRKPYLIMTDVGDMAMGDRHAAVVKTDGTLWLWGDNDTGQLRSGKYETPVKLLDGISRVFCYEDFTFAIANSGVLYLIGGGHDPVLIDGVERAEEVAPVLGGEFLVRMGDGTCRLLNVSDALDRDQALSPPVAEEIRQLCRYGVVTENGTLFSATVENDTLVLSPIAENVLTAYSREVFLLEDGTVVTPQGSYSMHTPELLRILVIALCAAAGVGIILQTRSRHINCK